MKALLICPAERSAVRFLAQNLPLANLPFLGKPIVAHWLQHLSRIGAKQVCILAADRPEQVRALVGDGSRWNLKVEVLSEKEELIVETARACYRGSAFGWLDQPGDVSVMDHFPGMPEHPFFKSYASWFNALRALMPRVAASSSHGTKANTPGVWVSPRARVSPKAELRAPCWIGAHAVIGPESIVGPMAVIEDRVMVGVHVIIANSTVAPETFVGQLTELKDSIADGSLLINWRTMSCTRVPDSFILCSLARRQVHFRSANWLGRLVALFVMAIVSPLAMVPLLWAKLRGQAALRSLVAVRPGQSHQTSPMETLTYHELAKGPAWLRAWPQLWNIVRGDFAWVGNRPLSPAQVSELSTDFERLWLAAPIGLLSLANAEGAIDAFEARVFSSLYALQANWRLDLSILVRACLPVTWKSAVALF